MYRHALKFGLSALAAVSLSACVSLGGDYPGNGGGQNYPDQRYPDQRYPSQAPMQSDTGTVDATDPQNGRFRLRTSRGSMIDMVYDGNSRLVYQGRQVDPQGLERGDYLRVQFRALGDGRYYVQDMEVLRNVRGETNANTPGTYNGARTPSLNTAIAGAVSRNDPQAKVIEFTRGGYTGVREYVRYDEYTVVEFQGSRQMPNGQRYMASQVEAGDMIRVDGRAMGNEVLAERITVTQSAQQRR